MMISSADIEKLLNFKGETYKTSSFYLNVDGSKYTPKDYETITKNLIKERRLELEAEHLPHTVMKSLEEDFEKIEHFVVEEFKRNNTRGLAIFSCSGKDFWQVYQLPRPVKNVLVIGNDPYIRPLTVLLDEYHRYCLVLVSRDKARIFEVYLGEILEHFKVFDEEVPGKVRIAGWYGLEEKRIERHIEYHVYRHLKQVADRVFDFFKEKRFDYLVIGGRSDILPEFERCLHSFLIKRLVARLDLDVETPINEIKTQILQIEKDVEQKQEVQLVTRLMEEVATGGFGVSGLQDTLKALYVGNIHTLLVEEDFSAPGLECRTCGLLTTVEEKSCPICQGPLEEVPDVVDEAIEEVYRQRGEVEHISNNPILRQLGRIGALLRFKMPVSLRALPPA
jgi:peptide chain release factor subunit 1